jgi:ATP-dependent Clp protease protease subunit
MDPLWEASLRHRILFLGTPIDEATVNSLIRALLLMNAEDPSAPIEIYINSAGGNILDGLALYNAMQAILASIASYSVGCALSMAAGSPGMRFATPNARVMIHEPATPVGQAAGSLSSVSQTHKLM